LLRNIHWHPVLLALYPSLHLLAQNTASVRPQAAFWSLTLSVAAVIPLFLLCSLIFRDRGKGAMLTALVTILFFAHGHLLKLVGGETGVAQILLAAGCLVVAGAGFFLARWRGNPRSWNRGLDLVAVVLVVMVLVPIVMAELRPSANLPLEKSETEVRAPLGYLPDIYVVVLDAFGRADQLKNLYGVDLSELQDHLIRKGFAVAEAARANYGQTSLSLAALFNANYLEPLLPGFKPGYDNKKMLNALVQSNRTVRRLRGMGYQLVTLAGGSELAVQVDPDVNYRGGALNEFQSALLATTPLPVFASFFDSGSTAGLDPYAQHREGVRYQLRKLPHVVANEGPKLVFAHILSPHPPFVIGAAGEDVTPEYRFSIRERDAWQGYVKGYADQATWMADELQKTVDGILAASRRPPVILIMGDHGPASLWIESWRKTKSFRTSDEAVMAERLSIFLALHLPDGEGGRVYPELSPVNIFPLIFERCFGEPAELREDRSFFSTYAEWSTLWEVPR
jgi:hypothetical protein